MGLRPVSGLNSVGFGCDVDVEKKVEKLNSSLQERTGILRKNIYTDTDINLLMTFFYAMHLCGLPGGDYCN